MTTATWPTIMMPPVTRLTAPAIPWPYSSFANCAETFEADNPEDAQREEAVRSLRSAITQLEEVAAGIETGELLPFDQALEDFVNCVEPPVVVLIGNISEGYIACGPYTTMDDACAATDGIESWVMTMVPPNKIQDDRHSQKLAQR